jgi:hypothetical protein
MYNRREFLMQSVWLALVPSALQALPSRSVAAVGATSSELETLAAAMDQIIPEGDGMPSASAAGGVQYLEYLGWQYVNIQEEISRFLGMLAQASAAKFANDFPELSPDQRLQVLTGLEKTDASSFSNFVSYLYEAYYTRPQVVGLLWCASSELALGDDEDLLAPVRKLTHLYREVP